MRLKLCSKRPTRVATPCMCPRLRGISEGDTLEEARGDILEAIALYLEPTDGAATPAGSLVEEISI